MTSILLQSYIFDERVSKKLRLMLECRNTRQYFLPKIRFPTYTDIYRKSLARNSNSNIIQRIIIFILWLKRKRIRLRRLANKFKILSWINELYSKVICKERCMYLIELHMRKYSLLYEQESLDKIKQFIEYLRYSMFQRFSDTWLHSIDVILNNYDEDLALLESSLFEQFEHLGKMGIIWTIYGEEWAKRKTRLIFPIRSYTITAWCIADTDAEVLTIESISINT